MDVAAGDIDADGSTDFVLSAPSLARPGSVYLQFGLASGVVEVADASVDSGRRDQPGAASRSYPDWTGDGGAEVVFGMPDRTSPARSSAGSQCSSDGLY